MFETVLDISLSAVMSLISALIVYFLLEKKAEKTIEKYKNQLKNEAEQWLNSDNGQKAIYSIGAIIGNGAKAGLGINARSGKFKIENLVGEIASKWIQERFIPQQQQQSQQKRSTSNNLNIQ